MYKIVCEYANYNYTMHFELGVDMDFQVNFNILHCLNVPSRVGYKMQDIIIESIALEETLTIIV